MLSKGRIRRAAEPFIRSMAAAASLEQVEKSLHDFCDEYGFEHYIFGALTPVSYVRPKITIVSGYPEEWRDHYNEKNYMAVDPTVDHCNKSLLPVNWAKLPECDKEGTACLDTARDYGLIDGVSVPLHAAGSEWGMISVASRKFESRSTARIVAEQLSLLVPHVHEAVKRTEPVKSDALYDDKVLLTAREKEVLLWSSEGKTTYEVAMILGITERTVTFHLQNTQQKLQVSNRTHAVARAISLGLINPIL